MSIKPYCSGARVHTSVTDQSRQESEPELARTPAGAAGRAAASGAAPAGDAALHTVGTGIRSGLSPLQFMDSIDAGGQQLGNRAFMHWVGQLHAGAPAGNTHEIAARGLQGPGRPLTHLDTLQQAFGHHDIRGMREHTGPVAGSAHVNAAPAGAAAPVQMSIRRSNRRNFVPGQENPEWDDIPALEEEAGEPADPAGQADVQPLADIDMELEQLLADLDQSDETTGDEAGTTGNEAVGDMPEWLLYSFPLAACLYKSLANRAGQIQTEEHGALSLPGILNILATAMLGLMLVSAGLHLDFLVNILGGVVRYIMLLCTITGKTLVTIKAFPWLSGLLRPGIVAGNVLAALRRGRVDGHEAAMPARRGRRTVSPDRAHLVEEHVESASSSDVDEDAEQDRLFYILAFYGDVEFTSSSSDDDDTESGKSSEDEDAETDHTHGPILSRPGTLRRRRAERRRTNPPPAPPQAAQSARDTDTNGAIEPPVNNQVITPQEPGSIMSWADQSLTPGTRAQAPVVDTATEEIQVSAATVVHSPTPPESAQSGASATPMNPNAQELFQLLLTVPGLTSAGMQGILDQSVADGRITREEADLIAGLVREEVVLGK